jgi:hypothetical protein
MKSTIYLIFVMILIFASSCSNETEDQLEFFENSFPGKWEIVKYKMPAWGQNIYFNGKTILNKDTTLTDLGLLEIPVFNSNQLLLNNPSYLPIEFTLQTPRNEVKIEISYIYARENGAFIAFRNTNSGNNDLEKFLTSSRIFNRNVELKFLDLNSVIILSPSELSVDTMFLERR